MRLQLPHGNSRWQVGGGFGGAVLGGLASKASFGATATLQLARVPNPGLSIAPSISVTGVSTVTDTASDSRGALALHWLAVIGRFCPVALALSSFAYLRPCSGLELGSLRGEGVAIEQARRVYAAWIAVELSGRLEIPLGTMLGLELDVGGAAPFDRPRFVYTSGVAAFEAPAFGTRTGLTLAFRH